jgi:hypothetical protein
MRRNAVAHLLTNVRMCVRVSTFRSINGVSERFDFDRRFLFQTALIRWRQAETETNAQFVQESFRLRLVQVRCHVELLVPDN